MTVPYWVQDAVFYQIFPDRFANGDKSNDPPNVSPWGSIPTSWNYMGGDLRGIIQRFDYLLDLGINAIYLNPIFQSAANHRYHTTDYFKIDPKLGDMSDFHAFLDVAHSNGVRVILDGVFNHCGRGFFAFTDLLENQERSPYRDWFHVNKFPVDAYGPGEATDYLAWWGMKGLPKLNTNNPEVRRYLFSVARYWIEQGADGWRLDVPNEIDDDAFWAEFRYLVKTVNRDAYIVGEIWNVDPRWIGDAHFDGLMNYPLREGLLKVLLETTKSAKDFVDHLKELLGAYPRQYVYAMYNTLGTHDTERILTKLEGNLAKLKLAYLFLFAFPGAPAIYYGDEIGMQGGGDPECRAAFPWDEGRWDHDLRNWVKDLIALRKRYTSLRRGDFTPVFSDERRQCYSFARSMGDETILTVMNASSARRHLRLSVGELGWKDGLIVHNLLGAEEYIVSGDVLSVGLPPWSGVWLK